MKREPFDLEHLEQLLRQTPERQAPADLQGKIMAQILTEHAPTNLVERLRRWWRHTTVLTFQPLRWGVSLAMPVLAFWLGTLVGGDDQARVTAQLPEEGAPEIAFAPFADSARANFLVGRGLLEAGEQQSALEFLQQAVQQAPRTAEYGHWQGVAYWQLGDREKERQSYLQSLAGQPDYIPALLNLGHNMLESGDYRQSLRQYEKVLQINPHEQAALYNRALNYHQLADQEKEREAFSRYLDSYRSDKWAYRAVAHLQHLGNFDYQLCLIGNRKIVVNQQKLLDSELPDRQLELERLARWLEKTSTVELQLIVYCQDDKAQGKALAEGLRQQLQAALGVRSMVPIRISWFDEPARIQTADGAERELARGLLIFTQPLTTEGRKV